MKIFKRFRGLLGIQTQLSSPQEQVVRSPEMLEKQAKLYGLLKKYESKGIVWGSAFALPPTTALLLVNDLESSDIKIAGVLVWYSVKKDGIFIGIAEDLSYSYESQLFVPESVFGSENSLSESASIIRDYIKELPESVELVSLTLYDDLYWRNT